MKSQGHIEICSKCQELPATYKGLCDVCLEEMGERSARKKTSGKTKPKRKENRSNDY